MDKWFLVLLCSKGYDDATRQRCQLILKQTIQQVQIYQTLKEKEKDYRQEAERDLTRPGFWATTTIISSLATKKIYLSGHNIMGIDSVNLKVARDASIDLTWSF